MTLLLVVVSFVGLTLVLLVGLAATAKREDRAARRAEKALRPFDEITITRPDER
jgi:hypothetical protein